MSHFLTDRLKETITLKQLVYSEVEAGERRHLVMSSAKLQVDDVVILQSETDALMNQKHPSSARDTWVIITTKETFAIADKKLSVYGFINVCEMPAKLMRLANNIYEANVELSQQQVKMMEQGISLL